MRAPSINTLPSPARDTLSGAWKLVRGRAITWCPGSEGSVRVVHGRVWATFDGPHGGTPEAAGDHFLQFGGSLRVRAGERVVLEAWNARADSFFTWDPALAPEPAAGAARSWLTPSMVLRPLADLRLAGAIAIRAAGQLAWGIARLASQLVLSARTARRRPRGFG